MTHSTRVNFLNHSRLYFFKRAKKQSSEKKFNKMQSQHKDDKQALKIEIKSQNVTVCETLLFSVQKMKGLTQKFHLIC